MTDSIDRALTAGLADHARKLLAEREELKALRQRLKSGEYDGTDIMKAWLALDDLIAERKRYAELFAAYSEACADAAISGWQPIDTAPRDGTYILAANEHGVWIAQWCPVAVSGYRFDKPWRSVMLNHWHMPKDVRYEPPTHWMPLPPPPPVSGVIASDGGQQHE